MNTKGHVHTDEVVKHRQSTGKNLLGQVVTANIVDLVCSSCDQKTVKYEATSFI